MSFIYADKLIPLLAVVIISSVLYVKRWNTFFKWVKTYWFLRPSMAAKYSLFFFWLSFFCFSLALLDLRGPEQKQETKAPLKNLVILLDASTSMNAEDVRPTRFKRALFLARHLVKNTTNTQIAILLFSDQTKAVVPFTPDKDLIDARLDGLSSMSLRGSGTALSLSLMEAKNWLLEVGESDGGQILVFSDAEETSSSFELDLGSQIKVGFVGVGTVSGGKIPMRNAQGVLQGNLRYQGEEVVSKLNEEFLKDLSKKIKNYRYWMATSFGLPTDGILQFFNEVQMGNEKTSASFRPVLTQYLIIPAIIFLIISLLLRRLKLFITIGLILLLPSGFADVKRNLEEKLKKGGASSVERAHLGTLYFQSQVEDPKEKELHVEKGAKLIEEAFQQAPENPEILLNHLTLTQAGNDWESAYQDRLKGREILKTNPQFEKTLRENTLRSLMQQEQQKNDQQKNKDKNEQQEKDQRGEREGEEGEKSQEKKKDKSDEKEKNDRNDGKDKKDKQQESDSDKGEKEKPKKKVPQILQQLMNDEKKVQDQMLDTRTKDSKQQQPGRKEW